MFTKSTILAALCLTCLPAFAGTTPSIETAPATSPWSCRVDIYGWVEALNGDAGVRGFTAPVDVKFSDILKHLDMAFMGAVEVNYNRWGFLADIMYAKIGDDGSGPFGSSFDVEYKQFLGNFFVTYEVAKTDSMKFDLYAGARVNSMSLDYKFTGPRGNKFGSNDSETWADPVIGARFQHDLGKNFFFRAVGDIGGHGATSQRTWQAMAGFGYSFHEYGSLLLGYRALGIDYKSDGFTYDVTTHGPVIGYEWKF